MILKGKIKLYDNINKTKVKITFLKTTHQYCVYTIN